MPTPTDPFLLLLAAPARGKDAGCNLVRLPREGLERLGVEVGDPVAIESCAGLLWARAQEAHPDDEDIDAVRVDATAIECPELITGDAVRVYPGPVRVASEIEIATDAEIGGEMSEGELREALARAPTLLTGDRVELEAEGETKGFDIDIGLVGLSLVQVVGTKGDIVGARVRIVSTVPDGPIRLGSDTVLRIRP